MRRILEGSLGDSWEIERVMFCSCIEGSIKFGETLWEVDGFVFCDISLMREFESEWGFIFDERERRVIGESMLDYSVFSKRHNDILSVEFIYS